MTPLAPLYLLAAIAVAGPILFHLWRRTPRGRRPFSTLMFLTPSPPRVTSRSRIEHWLLLILRGLALCLLALAFARPLWRTSTTGPEQPTEEELVAVLIDTSASMRREGAWQDLQRQLSERLAKLPPSAAVGVFRFDDRWAPAADFTELNALEPVARMQLIRSRLQDLQPNWGATKLGESLVRTVASLQELQADRSVPVKLRILLATDLQAGAKLDGLNSLEWPADLRLEILTAQPKSKSNAGLQWVERNPDLPDDVLRVRVSNSLDSRKEQFLLKWAGDDAEGQAIYVPPGQSRVVTPPKRPKQAAGTSLVLTGDDNEFDNALYIAPIKEESRMVVYCGNDLADDIAGLRFYLEGVYGASQRYKVQVVGWKDALGATNIDRPSFVVLSDPDPDAADFVKSYLNQGGTLLIAARSIEAGRSSLQQCGLGDLELTEAKVNRDSMLAEIDFEHPLFAPFAESQFSDFTGIRFWKHRHLAGFPLPASGTPAAAARPGQVLARFDDGDPAFVEFKAGNGHVWLLTSGWNPADSQLARSSKFPPLMYRMLEQASGVTTTTQNWTVGSSLPWPNRTLAKTGNVKLPDGTVLNEISTETPFQGTSLPGLYTFETNVSSDVIAVNLAADESRTSPLPIEQLEALGVKFGNVETAEQILAARDRQRQLKLEELEHDQKLWQWGILIAIGLILAETWLAGRRVLSKSSETSP